MKTRNILTGFILIFILAFTLPHDIFGQSKKVKPPIFAPAHGWKAKTRYVYFPDPNFYYDVKKNIYIYPKGKTWVESKNLPPKLAGLDLRRAAKVEIELDSDKPQKFNAEHIEKYQDKGNFPK